MKTVKPIPDGFHTATPYMIVKDATNALDFYKRAFAAVELYRLTAPDGHIGHAEFLIGNSRFMIADESPSFGALAPQTLGGSPIKIHLSVEDVDAFVKKAVAEGATILRPVKNEFHGNRGGMLADPFGHSWFVATQIEELDPAEMQKRWAKVFEAA